MQIDAIQAALREQAIDAWLFYDHHHRDPISYRILGLPANAHVTRRWYYVIPAEGEPRKLVHRIESGRLDSLPGSKGVYSSWQELETGLDAMLQPYTTLAMQYSPRNAIMYVSMVDAGTVEVLREFGKNIVSSADLVSRFEAILTPEQIASHYEAQAAIDQILAEGFREIGRRVRPANGNPQRVTEYDIVQWLSEAMRRSDLVWENGPNVSVNANSSDSHYEPTAEGSKEIHDGDFVLIDIWGRKNRPGTCFYDITWTGVVGREPSEREKRVFEVVKGARDAAVKAVKDAFYAREPIAGWQADDAARAVIQEAGFGQYFTHRTGHNIGNDIHGSGAHLDNLETHDERLILPNTCFSVEPGVYLDTFGIRSELNMITTAERASATGRIQQELVRI
ncbi:Xaa-Pro aminopeptidase [Silvibacterium bohemicum]|uniref:Xaa-Pro aminopeptidase n=1 Tax=Silvibacterium bohemicum TaxID=1577686 RepID=A0A841JY29_9BACT|nr:Xaa-Pro peptidase family protein [Silvibacterium bohemicum]MBB6144639.1 Xaa-Pro aminopeptidase [Silvibacterium bohemicum]